MASLPDEIVMSIPAQDLRMLLPFKANEDVRYYLNGIYIEPAVGGCLLVATNGHVLAAYHSSGSNIDKPRILAITKEMGKQLDNSMSEHKVVVKSESGRAVMRGIAKEVFIQPEAPFIDGTFPDWRKVIPPAEHLAPGLVAAIAAEYTTSIWRGLPKIYSGGGSAVYYYHDKREPKKSPIVARPQAFPDFIAVIMPMSGEWEAHWPSWLQPTKTGEAT